MALSQEMRDLIKDFFSTTEGQVLLQRLAAEVAEGNNLMRAVNAAQAAGDPLMCMAEQAGYVKGLQRALDLIQLIQEEG